MVERIVYPCGFPLFNLYFYFGNAYKLEKLTLLISEFLKFHDFCNVISLEKRTAYLCNLQFLRHFKLGIKKLRDSIVLLLCKNRLALFKSNNMSIISCY